MPESFELTVDGEPLAVVCGPDTALLWVLRDSGRTGTRFGCGVGSCGACTVLLGGSPVRSCETPMRSASGRDIVTVEGLGRDGRPHPVQEALLAEQAGQCGFCLSGIAVRAAALVDRDEPLDDATVRAELAEHLCRCGAHNRIVRAVLRASERSS